MPVPELELMASKSAVFLGLLEKSAHKGQTRQQLKSFNI